MSVLAFPLKCRHAFVRRLAAQVLARKASDGERHLEAQLRRQAVSMARKGFSDDVARRETASLEAAVRREIWRIVLRAPPPSKDGQRDTSA